jgi:PAS domain-containing protein
MPSQTAPVASATLQQETAPVVEQLPAGIFRKDAAGRFVFVNERFCHLKRTPAERILGRTAAEIASSEAAQQPHSPWRPELAEREDRHHAQIVQTGQQLEREEVFLARADSHRPGRWSNLRCWGPAGRSSAPRASCST